MKIAVISDIHSAYTPFKKAVQAARREGFDKIILLGDIFTYGVNPTECSELVSELIAKDGAILIEGNHDLIYRELTSGGGAYYNSLPDWIRESADWTWNEMGRQWPVFMKCLPEWSIESLLFAHANPFEFGDWTYLSSVERLRDAAATCLERGYRFGIFGHLHRSSYYRTEQVEIHVIGSIGQPRSRDDPNPHWAIINFSGDQLTVHRRPVEFDPKAHCAAIWNTPSLSDMTKNKLCRYFK